MQQQKHLYYPEMLTWIPFLNMLGPCHIGSFYLLAYLLVHKKYNGRQVCLEIKSWKTYQCGQTLILCYCFDVYTLSSPNLLKKTYELDILLKCPQSIVLKSVALKKWLKNIFKINNNTTSCLHILKQLRRRVWFCFSDNIPVNSKCLKYIVIN